MLHSGASFGLRDHGSLRVASYARLNERDRTTAESAGKGNVSLWLGYVKWRFNIMGGRSSP